MKAGHGSSRRELIGGSGGRGGAKPGGAGREPGRGGDGGRSQLCSRGWPLLLETRWDRTRGGVNPGGGGRGSGVRSWRSGGGHPSCALGGRHWGWTRAGSTPGAGSTRAARVETPIAVGGGRSQLCSGDPHCGWEGTGSMAGVGEGFPVVLSGVAMAAGNAHCMRSWVPKGRHPVGAAEGCGPQVRELGLRGAGNHVVRPLLAQPGGRRKGISQARILEWVVISFFRESS